MIKRVPSLFLTERWDLELVEEISCQDLDNYAFIPAR